MDKTRPECCNDKHLAYLDKLRENGSINMFAAAPYLKGAFGLDRFEAKDVLLYWMATFDERHKEGE